MSRLFALASVIVLCGSAAHGQSGNTAGTATEKAPASSGLSGIDLTQAGNDAASQKKWFEAQTRDEQARIMQACNDMPAVNSKLTQQDTTGSVAAATTDNSAANVDSNMSSTGTSTAQLKTFCLNIK
jgi:hypothetical protein